MGYKDTLKNIQNEGVLIEIETMLISHSLIFDFFKGVKNQVEATMKLGKDKPVILNKVCKELEEYLPKLTDLNYLITKNTEDIGLVCKHKWDKEVDFIQNKMSILQVEKSIESIENIIKENDKAQPKKKIIATNETIHQIIKDEIKKYGNRADLNHIDVSSVTLMDELFYYLPHFKGDISNWDVSNVTNMNNMFFSSSFNGDLSKWNPVSLQKPYSLVSGGIRYDWYKKIKKL